VPEQRTDAQTTERPHAGVRPRTLVATLIVTAIATFGVTALLVSIFGRKQEARVPFVRVVEVDEGTTDPAPWGANWPRQYDGYLRTVDATHTRYGGSSAMPESKLEEQPWLRRMYSGYAFSIDYRERRGHAYMLSDQLQTRRVTERSQPGACLHCHSSVIPTYRRLGLEEMGEAHDAAALAADFRWDAVMAGFEQISTIPYHDAYDMLAATPDGTGQSDAHPVSCVDCHDPESMALRVTRPGFVNGIAALAAGDAPTPHLPSIERWREGPRSRPYDPNLDATRQEMRSFSCAQCHVEYYCGPKETLFFPWDNGLRVEDIERTYGAHTFPDGEPFYDWTHGETGAKVYKAQHPEFELWSQGIHARSGVSCADCHMPYEREGAMKVSSHWVRSPLLNLNNSCQVCHNVPEQELLGRVHAIQDRTKALIDRAADALVDMLDAIGDAQAAGATDEQLAPVLELQKKAQWRLDFISSENSMGFHADQEAARILAEAIDYARTAQAMAQSIRTPAAPDTERPSSPVEGVTPTEQAPPGPYRKPKPAEPPDAQEG
jgi:nitrite reductase (cytochrome c-552)